jgi:hypothetical protein
MDYREFLNELESACSAAGVDFEYFNGGSASPINNYILREKINLPNPPTKTYTWNRSEVNIKNEWIKTENYNNKRENFKVFQCLADLVYFLALSLSRKIGRLPEALHARMMMSTDDNANRKEYVRNHGR